MKKNKTIEQRYRFKLVHNELCENVEYHVFESRYYAEKFLKEQMLYVQLPFDVYEGVEYNIERVIDGFVIVKSVKNVI